MKGFYFENSVSKIKSNSFSSVSLPAKLHNETIEAEIKTLPVQEENKIREIVNPEKKKIISLKQIFP